MSNIIFSFARSDIEYKNINPYVDFVFARQRYGKNCLLMNDLSIINIFNYYFNEKKYEYFCYIDSKCSILDGYKKFLDDEKSYFNFYNKKIYFLKYKKNIYSLFEVFKDELSEDNFFYFLNNYFFCFNHKINFYLDGKVVFPRNKLLYNMTYEKLKNKKH